MTVESLDRPSRSTTFPPEGSGSGGDTAGGVAGSPPEASTGSRRAPLLARLLRLAGVTILLAAAGAFLLQRWQEGGDVQRYLWLLGFTAGLAGTGLACAFGLREQRSARSLLATALAVVPVHFAVLGGLVYSRLSWDGAATSLPSFALWHAPSATAALITVAVALAVLAPVTLLALRVLVPEDGRRAGLLFLASGALLLLPVRAPGPAGALFLVLLAAPLATGWKRFSAPGWRTFEGRVVRLLLAAPAALAAGRALLRDPDALFVGLAAAGLAAVCLALAEQLAEGPGRALRVTASGLFGMAAAALAAAASAGGLSAAGSLAVATVLWSGALVAVAATAGSDAPAHRLAAALVALAGGGALLALEAAAWSGVLALVLGLLALAHSFLSDHRWLAAPAGLLALAALAVEVRLTLSEWSAGHWVALAAVGLATVVAGALAERHGARLHALAERWRERRDRAA